MLPLRLVQELGEGSWSQIAAFFPGRIGKQCRERWNNQLRPDIRRDAWTHAEEELLVVAHKSVGNRYSLNVLLMCLQQSLSANANYGDTYVHLTADGPKLPKRFLVGLRILSKTTGMQP